MSEFNDQLAAIAAKLERPIDLGLDAVPILVIPDSYKVANVEQMLAHPKRIRGGPTFIDLDSFSAYAKAFRGSATRVFASLEGREIIAILDYHDSFDNEPSWCSHRATLKLTHSPQWLKWTAAQNTKFEQAEFGEFLEDNLTDFAMPSGDVILKAALDLDLTRTVKFRSGVRLGDGRVNLTYDEEINGGKGELVLPEKFILGLAPFIGVQSFKIEGRLRYRISKDDGYPRFYFKLMQLEEAKERAFKDMAARIENELDVPVHFGCP